MEIRDEHRSGETDTACLNSGKIGSKPEREKNHEAIYFSPLRTEKTASFHVNNAKNIWYDFGPGIGGSVVELVCAYLQSRAEACTIPDALRWVKNMSGYEPGIMPIAIRDPDEGDKKLVLKSAKPIGNKSLIICKSAGFLKSWQTTTGRKSAFTTRPHRNRFLL